MQKEASIFGLQINWSKTKVPSSTSSSTVQVADGHVEVVDAFVYMGCLIDSSGGSRGEVLHRIGLARSCMNMLERRIWKSSIKLETKLRLYHCHDTVSRLVVCCRCVVTGYFYILDNFVSYTEPRLIGPFECAVYARMRAIGLAPLY